MNAKLAVQSSTQTPLTMPGKYSFVNCDAFFKVDSGYEFKRPIINTDTYESFCHQYFILNLSCKLATDSTAFGEIILQIEYSSLLSLV